jgi:hypothetical protein
MGFYAGRMVLLVANLSTRKLSLIKFYKVTLVIVG